MIKKGEWVEIHNIILNKDERAKNLPEDTKNVPLEMWVKGYLIDDANIGDICKIKTATNRIVEGELVGVNMPYTHNYGQFVNELNCIRDNLKKILF